MNARRWVVGVLLLAAVAGIGGALAGYLYESSQDPPGQPPVRSQSETSRDTPSRRPRARVVVRKSASYSIPPQGYESPRPGFSFSPADGPGYIKQTALKHLVDEVRHLKDFVREHHGDKSGFTRRNMIRRTAKRSLERMRTRLDESDHETLLEWVLTREDVIEADTRSRRALLRGLEPDSPPVPLETDPRLARSGETDCRVVFEAPGSTSPHDSPDTPPRYGFLTLEERPDGSASFRAPFDFRQSIPGPMPHTEHPDMDPYADTAYEAYRDESDTIPPHPVLETLAGDAEDSFILIGDTRAYPARRVSVSDPRFSNLGYHWMRTLQGTVSPEDYDGSEIALGYVGRKDRLPDVPEISALRVPREDCRIRTLADTLEVRRGKDARFQVAYSLGQNARVRRLVLEYRLRASPDAKPERWTGFADLTDEGLAVRYVLPMEDDRARRNEFLTEEGVSLAADRDRDGLADLIYSKEAGFVSGTLVLLDGRAELKHPQHSTD